MYYIYKISKECRERSQIFTTEVHLSSRRREDVLDIFQEATNKLANDMSGRLPTGLLVSFEMRISTIGTFLMLFIPKPIVVSALIERMKANIRF